MSWPLLHTGKKLPLAWTFGVVLLLLGSSCEAPQQPEAGAQLAQQYCSGCHPFPSPDLLDRETWATHTLPVMGYRLGIYGAGERDSLIAPFLKYNLDPDPYFPRTAQLSSDQWAAIHSYYAEAAPKALPAIDRQPPAGALPGFRVQTPAVSFSTPLTTLVQIQDGYQAYLVGNYAANSSLVLLNAAGELQFNFALPGAPVATHIDGRRLYILIVGAGPEPTVSTRGAVYVVDDPAQGPQLLINGLQRPVDFQLGDLDGNGLNDLVICEYGHYAGALSLYTQRDPSTFDRHVLKQGPGTIAAQLHDFDGDNQLDIVALTAQGNEGVDILFNRGDGQFEAQRVLEFPAVYGSTSLLLEDFNGDGLQDLLYTNGDNADTSPILKNYHGIRIFEAVSSTSFEEAYFYPMYGAFAAQAADFNQDGRIDIAAISYFPDYVDDADGGFVLLLQNGPYAYNAHTFENAGLGRWLVMDTGDTDGDGDTDILLGSNIGFGPAGDRLGLYAQWTQGQQSAVLLENEIQ
ncbi:MAG: VCBS repeat-containing protein [Bacteroidota bacterium]